MSTDLKAAIQFVYANARLLDRRRLEHLLGEASSDAVVEVLVSYQNPDGGFGHALEPDMRAPGSEPSATLLALETLLDVGVTDHPVIAHAAEWIATTSSPDGTLPQMSASGAGYPHAPFINPGGPAFLTFALAGALWRTEARPTWLDRATAWCWHELELAERPHTYTVVFALRFLDAVPDEGRAVAAIERLQPLLDETGGIPVPGGVEDERVTPLDLSPRPGTRSRRLFDADQIELDAARLETDQLEDGGWDFDWLHWSPGQAIEWRGSVTVNALQRLRDHGRIPQAVAV